jgi:hypothetical protein
VAEDNADKRRDRHQRAVAAAGGALLGGVVAGPLGAAAGAGLGPLLEPLVAGVWEELSVSARQRQVEVLASAIDAGIREDELGERINASERTQLLTGFALSAATRTAWEDKVRTLGRSLASGLLADDNAKIDTEQMIIAAITDIEGPQLAMLEFLVSWEPGRYADSPPIDGPLDIPEYSHDWEGRWQADGRVWTVRNIAYARPTLAPITPSLLGTLQRHGLVVENDNASEAIERYSKAYEKQLGNQFSRADKFRPNAVPRVPSPGRLVPQLSWSPTELGEQVFLRFRDAGTELPEVWASGPADQQQLQQPVRADLPSRTTMVGGSEAQPGPAAAALHSRQGAVPPAAAPVRASVALVLLVLGARGLPAGRTVPTAVGAHPG